MAALSQSINLRVPFRSVLLSVLVIWSVYFLFITVRGQLVGFEFNADLIGRRSLVTAMAMTVTLLLWLVIRPFEKRKTWIVMAGALIAALPGAFAIAQFNQFVFAPLQEKMQQQLAEKQGVNLRRDEAGNLLVEIPLDSNKSSKKSDDMAITLALQDPEERIGNWALLVDAALTRYYILLTWVALYLAMLAIARARLAERREQEFRNAAKIAEIRSLRYQVNPHFLFNTLNSLSALVMTGQAGRAEKMIQTISSFYRHSLTNEPTSDVVLEQEFELQRHYLNIEEARFPERLKTVFDLPEELADARIPGMILQPLVENSVKYAVAPINRTVTVRLSAREEWDRLIITVTDDGPGIPEGMKHGFGIGLANVRDRLEARFGPDIRLTSGPIEGGYQSEIRIPLTRNAL